MSDKKQQERRPSTSSACSKCRRHSTGLENTAFCASEIKGQAELEHSCCLKTLR